MDKTKIEWAEATWNPVDGCTPVSEGCKHCYAANIAKRFWGDREFSDIRFHKNRLEQPLKWKEPRIIFVCSMGDLFHPLIKTWILNDIFTVITKSWEMARGHVFLLLTKRPDRMKRYINEHRNYETAVVSQETSNVWLGVTAENQKQADKRIPTLLEIPAKIRFVSIEPMLGPVNMTEAIYGPEPRGMNHFGFTDGFGYEACIQWVICGGETGLGAREMEVEWAIDLRDQCKSAEVPFFFKQMSKKVPIPKDLMIREYPK